MNSPELSAAALPAPLHDAYRAMNESIARNNQAYGATLQADHLAASRRDIADTAHAALRQSAPGERNAIILGAGGCFDIPLEELADGFDKTTVVDVNTEQTEKALSRLPAKTLGRVSLVSAEISGIAGAVHSALEEASQEKGYEQFLAAAAAKISGLDVAGSQAKLGGPYAFVCSQLLMTQLSAIPFRHASNLVAEKYGRALSLQPGGADEALMDAFNDLNIRVQIGHLAQLGRLSKRDGTIHFADTIAEARGFHNLPMVLLPVFNELAKRFHKLRAVHEWQWEVLPGLAYYVRSYALAAKQDNPG